MDLYRPITYSSSQIRNIRVVYVISVILWILMASVFGLFQHCISSSDWIGLAILFIPIATFGVSFASASRVTRDVEDDLFKVDYLALGLLIILPLMNWISGQGTSQTRNTFLRLIMTAIILSLLAKVDFWVSVRDNSIIRHVKSAMMTVSLTLVIYALYEFYVESCGPNCNFGNSQSANIDMDMI